jgi:predicted amidohydrolase
VAVVQNAAGAETEANLAGIERLLRDIRHCDLIALPEVFAFRGSERDYRRKAEPVPGPLTRRLANWARRRRAWILAGSLIEKAGRRVFNTSVLIDPAGRLAAIYRKLHLFEARLESGQLIREADAYDPGENPVLARLGDWRCGMAICYDLRFPELFRRYSAHGAHLLFAPSNFTQRTGKDHWEVLVRARAIENQCFVVAPNQCGANPVTGVTSYGHSLAIGPWGEILGAAGAAEGAFAVRLDPRALAATRARVPALRHRRL